MVLSLRKFKLSSGPVLEEERIKPVSVEAGSINQCFALQPCWGFEPGGAGVF